MTRNRPVVDGIRWQLLPLLLILAGSAPAGRADEAAISATALRTHQRQVFQAALERIAPTIVRIDTIGGAQAVREIQDRGGDTVVAATFRQADGPTTGVLWTRDGYILTSSFNFVRQPAIITATLADGKRFVAHLVARDRVAQLALLKIETEDLPTPPRAPLEGLRPGQWALTAGLGYGSAKPALSVGVISGLRRNEGLCAQTDAKTSPANYGGPLLDIEGRLIGICIPKAGRGTDEIAGVEWYDSGIGFAVTHDHLNQRFEALRSGTDWHAGVLGILTSKGDRAVGDDSPSGVRIERLAEDGPAMDAGLEAADRIVELDGHAVDRPLDLRRALATLAAGQTVSVAVDRDGKRIRAELTLRRADEVKPIEPPTSQPSGRSQPFPIPVPEPQP